MNRLTLWQQRLVQTLHDPVHKAMVLGTGRKHTDVATDLSERLVGLKLTAYHKAPDRIAAGADRPMLGGGQQVGVDWRRSPILTHPLQPGAALRLADRLSTLGTGATKAVDGLTASLGDWFEQRFASEETEDDPPHPWKDLAAVEQTQLQLWRALPELMCATGYPILPADSRTPDHSIADHLRVTAALAFTNKLGATSPNPAQEPVLLTLSLRGVQAFITEARKARDLWTASMLYAELAWAMTLPIVRRYGPEAILYPDLRGNPLVDQWLHTDHPQVIRPLQAQPPRTRAAVMPNKIFAVVPRGGEGELLPVAELVEEARNAVAARWRGAADAVRRHLLAVHGPGAWEAIWARQLQEPPELVAVAVDWNKGMEGQGAPPDLAALPGREGPPAQLPPVLQAREAALRPWIPVRTWEHYEALRTVSWRVEEQMVQATPQRPLRFFSTERGFDYALVHHKLISALRLAKGTELPTPSAEPGEKCSLTGRHEALSNTGSGASWQRRNGARDFWAHPKLDPDRTGAERLGGLGALKRFAAEADRTLRARWGDDRGAPFPSTAAIAAGAFLEKIGDTWPRLAGPVRAWIAALDRTELKRDSLDRAALPRLRRYFGRDPVLDRLLQTEPEYLHPEALEIYRERQPGRGIEDLIEHTSALRAAAKRADLGSPGTRLAVLAADGDKMSRLLLGDPNHVIARWRDVLHPEAVAALERPDGPLAGSGWQRQLDRSRAMGPSLHAAITRAITNFAHRIVGWVVEREYGGRLIYAGGDDLLAMLPADEAVEAAARLQQLFSAAWVVDTAPNASVWDDTPTEREAARRRLRVVRTTAAVPSPLSALAWEEPVFGAEAPPPGFPEGAELLPLLGRGHALSAGLAIGHYKTPLQSLLRAAREALDERAKAFERPARWPTHPADPPARLTGAALSVDWFTRSGSKVQLTAGWETGETSPDPAGPPALARALRVVREGYKEGQLPRRLAYKLRERLTLLGPALTPAPGIDDTRDARLRRLLVLEAGVSDGPLVDAACALLHAGAAAWDDDRGPDRAVGGLLLARALAGGDDD